MTITRRAGSHIKSSYSRTECVQVRHLDNGNIQVSNSKTPDVEPHEFTPAEWVAFVAGVKASEFDLT